MWGVSRAGPVVRETEKPEFLFNETTTNYKARSPVTLVTEGAPFVESAVEGTP